MWGTCFQTCKQDRRAEWSRAAVTDSFCGTGTMNINNLIKLVEAIGALEPRVVALLVVALAIAAAVYIAVR